MFDQSFSARTVVSKIPVKDKGRLSDLWELRRLAQFPPREVGLTRFSGLNVFAVPLGNLVPISPSFLNCGMHYNRDVLLADGTYPFRIFPIIIAQGKCAAWPMPLALRTIKILLAPIIVIVRHRLPEICWN